MKLDSSSQRQLLRVNNTLQKPFEIVGYNWFFKMWISIIKFLSFKKEAYITICFGNKMYTYKDNYITKPLLFHELTHYLDRCIYDKDLQLFRYSIIKSIWVYMKYAFPQLLSLLSLLYFIFPNPYILLFLLFILPNPLLSIFRYNYELRGYFWNWLDDYDYKSFYTDYNDVLTSMTYFMTAFPKKNSVYENKIFPDIKSKVNNDPVLSFLYNIWYK